MYVMWARVPRAQLLILRLGMPCIKPPFATDTPGQPTPSKTLSQRPSCRTGSSLRTRFTSQEQIVHIACPKPPGKILRVGQATLCSQEPLPNPGVPPNPSRRLPYVCNKRGWGPETLSKCARGLQAGGPL